MTIRTIMSRALPHMGHFTRGSRWRFVESAMMPGGRGKIPVGTEFTVAGGTDYKNRIIPVTDTIIDRYATSASEAKAGKHVTGSLNHDYIFRQVGHWGEPILGLVPPRVELRMRSLSQWEQNRYRSGASHS